MDAIFDFQLQKFKQNLNYLFFCVIQKLAMI